MRRVNQNTKKQASKYKMTNVQCTFKLILHTKVSSICFYCVTPDSVSLARHILYIHTCGILVADVMEQ